MRGRIAKLPSPPSEPEDIGQSTLQEVLPPQPAPPTAPVASSPLAQGVSMVSSPWAHAAPMLTNPSPSPSARPTSAEAGTRGTPLEFKAPPANFDMPSSNHELWVRTARDGRQARLPVRPTRSVCRPSQAARLQGAHQRFQRAAAQARTLRMCPCLHRMSLSCRLFPAFRAVVSASQSTKVAHQMRLSEGFILR